MVRVSGMPRRAAARRCAYHTEQKSLERTFESLDPATIAEVLASHSGNMEAAAMDLVEFERAGLARNARGLSSSDDAEKARDDADEPMANAAGASFWNDVLEDVTMEDEDERRETAGLSEGDAALVLADGATPYASWPVDQWPAVETNVLGTATEDLNLTEKLVGWRRAPPAPAPAPTPVGDGEGDAPPPPAGGGGGGGDDTIEILVKFKGRALVHCAWVSMRALASELALASQRLAKFWEKHPRAAGEVVAVPRACLAVVRVLAVRDGDDETDASALVRWGGGLGCEEATWEPLAWVRENASAALASHEAVLARVPAKLAARAAFAEKRATQSADLADLDEGAVPETRDWYGGEANVLRGYQREGVRWMAHNLVAAERGCVLADEMGLGKTAQSLALVDYILRASGSSGAGGTDAAAVPSIAPRGPALVVVPLSTLVNWEREAARWAPDAHVVSYVGNPAARALLRKYELTHGAEHAAEEERAAGKDASDSEDAVSVAAEAVYKADVVLTTYEMAQADRSTLAKVPWSCLIVDEAHRLKNSGGRAARDLRSLDFARRVVLLTGTPLQNDTAELWSLLNFVDGRRFARKEEFEAKFGAVKAAGQVEALHKVLAPYLLRRLKQDVEHKLPPRVETLIECELMPLQKKCYRALFERNFQFLAGGCGDDRALANFNNVMMEVRKCCQHPFLIDGVEEAFVAQQAIQKGRAGASSSASVAQLVACAGKLQLLDKLLPRLKAGGHRVLVFSQMTRVLDVLEDYSRSRGHSYERLDGGVTGRARQAAIDRFCGGGAEDGSPARGDGEEREGAFLFLLSTRAGGQGINLVAADTVIVFDSDWNPQNDAQALARAHRIGQTKPVQVYRLVMRATYERDMLDRAAMKLGLEQAIFGGVQTGERSGGSGAGGDRAAARAEIERLLRHGAYGAMSEDQAEAEKKAKAWGAEGIDDILARCERRVVEASDNSADAEGDACANKSMFATATFAGAGDAGGEDEIALDDPDFWEKLMPEAAAAEKVRAELEAKEEAERLAAERASDAAGTRRRAVAEDRPFQWTWAERKSVVDKLTTFGFGRWRSIRAASRLDDDKTAAHVAAFCRRYALHAASSLAADACPFLFTAICAEPSLAEAALPLAEGGRKTLDAVFGEPLFQKFALQRAAEDVARLELLQPLVDAVAAVGGETKALAANRASWLVERPEFLNVQQHCDAPAPWWTPRDDVALLVGTLRHGYGKYDAVRADPELGLEASLANAVAAAARSPRSTPGRAAKRKRSSTDSAASNHSEDAAKENDAPASGNKKRTRVSSKSATGEEPASLADVGPAAAAAPEWPLNRVLSVRVRRLCAALAGKLAVEPPKPKPPKAPKPPKEPKVRGPRAGAVPGNLDKVQRAKLQIEKLPRDENGLARLPFGPVHGVTLEALGVVQPPSKVGYHSAAYVLPVGYRSSRQYMRCDDPNGPRTKWTQEIVEGEDGPMFRLSADEGLDGGPIVAKSATAAWAEVLRRVTAARAALGEEPKKTAISGPEFFGYSLPHIRLLVEELPGVAECVEYQHLMERKPAGQKSEVTEAKGAGRAEETNARAADE